MSGFKVTQDDWQGFLEARVVDGDDWSVDPKMQHITTDITWPRPVRLLRNNEPVSKGLLVDWDGRSYGLSLYGDKPARDWSRPIVYYQEDPNEFFHKQG